LNFPEEVSEFLTKLNDLFDDGTDLRATFLGLTDNLTTAIPFFLGLTLTLYTEAGHEGQLTLNILSPTDAATVRTSLVLRLDGLGRSGHGSILTLYAGLPGAFADLAVVARNTFGNDRHVVLDEDLPAAQRPTAAAERMQQHDVATINQAIRE